MIGLRGGWECYHEKDENLGKLEKSKTNRDSCPWQAWQRREEQATLGQPRATHPSLLCKFNTLTELIQLSLNLGLDVTSSKWPLLSTIYWALCISVLLASFTTRHLKHLTLLMQYKVSPLAPFHSLRCYIYFTNLLEYWFYILTRTRQSNSKCTYEIKSLLKKKN